MSQETDAVLRLLEQHEDQIITEWQTEAGAESSRMTDAGRRGMLGEAKDILQTLRQALKGGADPGAFQAAPWDPVRRALEALSRSRAAQGQSAGETSVFVLAFKRPLFKLVQKEQGADAQRMMALVWTVTALVDKMAQWTVTTYQQTREDIIKRQQEELLELSTPVIKLWQGVLAVPMIGILDSNRTQIVMESLLQEIVRTGSTLSLIHI